MKLLATLFLLAASFAAAQSFEVPIPNNWGGCGAAYNGSRVSNWCSVAVLVAPSQQLYSYTTYDVAIAHGVPTTSVRTGFAPILRHYTLGKNWDLALIGMATMGTSQTAVNLFGSLSGGGQLMIRYHQRVTFQLGVRQATGPAPGPYIEAGIGLTLD
jgi:hypothetical protein